ncbi:MAG: HPt (histidine-containing phosphotransfer) domain-containing protein [Lentimonas sp.]|jgi:HPt (histidine-containing phosphotransfer) domain-containing protein
MSKNMKNIPVPVAIDLNFLREVTVDDVEFENEIFDLFLDTANDNFDKFEDALNNDDSNAWYTHAHSFKGSSSSIGAFYLAEIAEYAQSHPKDSKEQKSEIFDELKKEFARVKEFIIKTMKETAKKSKKSKK